MNQKKNIITTDDVKHIAKLASLKLPENMISKYQNDLNEIMNFMNEIKQLDLKSIKGTTRTTEEENILREDKVFPSLTQEEALANAKKSYQGYFVVPIVLRGK